MRIETGNPLKLLVEFKGSNGELMEPVSNSFTYSLRRVGGATLTTVSPTLGAGDTTHLIVIESPLTDKLVNSDDFDRLFLEYSYNTTNSAESVKIPVFITNEINYMVDPKQVRRIIGCSELELSDEDIDLYGAYIKEKNTISESLLLDDLLIQGGYISQLANDIIMYRAAIDSVSTIQIRLLQSHQEDNIVASRFKDVDLNKLEDELNKRYAAAYLGMNDQLGDLIIGSQEVDFFLVFNPTPDSVTGA